MRKTYAYKGRKALKIGNRILYLIWAGYMDDRGGRPASVDHICAIPRNPCCDEEGCPVNSGGMYDSLCGREDFGLNWKTGHTSVRKICRRCATVLARQTEMVE